MIQAVGVDGETLATLPVISGVSQDSVLALLLFLVHIELWISRHSTLRQYPDSYSLQMICQPIRDVSDLMLLQSDVDTISDLD